MIGTVIDLVRYINETMPSNNVSRMLTRSQRIAKVIAVRVRHDKEKWTYDRCSLMDYDESKAELFLYRQGPSAGPGTTPAALVTEAEKTVPKKFLAWFKKNLRRVKDLINPSDYEVLKAIGDALTEAQSDIVRDVNKKLNMVDRSQGNTLLTIIVDDDTGQHFLGEIDAFVEAFEALTKKSYYEKYDAEARGKGVCFVCNKHKEVYGFVTDIFPFYTLDKPGFAPSLHVADGWKSFPVCFECALLLEAVKWYLDQNLKYRFYGAGYYLVPRFARGDAESVSNTLEILESQRSKQVTIAEEDRFTDDESEIWEVVSELEDSVALNFFFYIMEQSSMRILYHAEDVAPSRLATMFIVKKDVQKHGLFGTYNIPLNFSILRDITAMNRDAKDYKEFLSITGRILMGREVDMDLLYRRVMHFIERRARRDGPSRLAGSEAALAREKQYDPVVRAMMLIEFIQGLYSGGVTDQMTDFAKEMTRAELAKAIFEEHPSFFESRTQRAAFLLGVLVGRLIAIQQRERGAAPFEKKLHNLRLNRRRLERLMVQTQEKLMAYQKANYYWDLFELLSEEFMASEGESIDDDRVSFAFVIGLNQSFRFKSTKGVEEE